MSKWRPAEKDCLYVVGDVHGALSKVELICNRILPLRKTDGIRDELVFLGDYIDRHIDSHKTLDYLIDLKRQYGSQVIFLRGNHEQMLLKAANKIPGQIVSPQDRITNYRMWISNGGLQTLMGYVRRSGLAAKKLGAEPTDAQLCLFVSENYPIGIYSCSRLEDIIPKEHWEFMLDTLDYWERGQFLFVHGGCNPEVPIRKQDPEALYWDRRLVSYVLNCINAGKEEELNWEPTIVTGHSGPKPVIHDKFLMLDVGGPRQLLVTELNSREAFIAKEDNAKLTTYKLEKTAKIKPIFKRVT